MKRMGQWKPDQTFHLAFDFLHRSDAADSAHHPGFNGFLGLLIPLLQARGFVDPHGVTAFYDSLVAHSPTMSYVDTVNSRFWDRLFRKYYIAPFAMTGQIAPVMSGTYRYQATEAAATSPTWPNAGHVSLLVMIRNDFSPSRAAMLRRLAAQYGAQGLTITLITKTNGYWLKDGPNTGPMPPAEEAAHDSAYYLGYLRLPFTLMVDSTTFTHDSEHRLIQAAPVPFESAYGARNWMMVLTDRTGHVIVADVIDDEVRLSAYVRQAFGQ
jgi:hypothetical protein